ncbi:2-dehydropantoate 2-reductase [Suhomyces tanzawaensis NRRL Y-17324]|uniref:2-dehydropantoate 2-reductase n=1 Tax=Suhomyces tanzawaensis NRRL Y-17324 TaxID=984487 RepID=A0A1E4SPE3_9ASCO|nr:2-dehydropantoate 2-reductase [Suhomyces tanzawaensis NRRL Y-17324]ODV81391.1 2-dehydropantoate 2-reductase [Suhomyces tanzawaensis NRRL Y-17324]
MAPKVLIVGSGGVGVICAYSLTKRAKSEVTLVVRSDYQRVSTQGLNIDSVNYGTVRNWIPSQVAPSVETARTQYGPFDYIFLCTKNVPDSRVTCEDIIRPAVSENTTILLLQNGIDIEKPMHKAFPHNLILSGISLIGSTNSPNLIQHKALEQVFVGDFDKSQSHPDSQKALDEIIDIYHNEGFNLILPDADVRQQRWNKLLYNATFNIIAGLTGVDACRCQITGANSALIEPAMREIMAIAKSEGYDVPEALLDKLIHIGDGLFYRPSMLTDVHNGQLTEVETVLGNPVRIAQKNGVAVPILNTLYSMMKIKQFSIKEQRKDFVLNEEDFKGNSDGYEAIFEEKYASHH